MKTPSPTARLIASLLLFQAAPSFGAPKSAPDAPAQRSDLPKELAQTLASLFSITIQDYFIASRWGRPGTANVVEFRSAIPFKVWGQENLMRVNIPFRTESELGPGLSDARIFDLVTFKTGSGFWGIGPVVNLGINRGPGIDSLQAGPAATAMVTSVPSLSFGLLNQNFFNSQVSLSALQPICVYQPNDVWTIGLGELPFVYNWKTQRFAVFSIGLQLGALIRAAEQPIRFFVNPQFNTRDNTQLYQWTIASGFTLPISPVTQPVTR